MEEEKYKKQLLEIMEWYAKIREMTIGEFDDIDTYICRTIQKYVNDKMSSCE